MLSKPYLTCTRRRMHPEAPNSEITPQSLPILSKNWIVGGGAGMHKDYPAGLELFSAAFCLMVRRNLSRPFVLGEEQAVLAEVARRVRDKVSRVNRLAATGTTCNPTWAEPADGRGIPERVDKHTWLRLHVLQLHWKLQRHCVTCNISFACTA